MTHEGFVAVAAEADVREGQLLGAQVGTTPIVLVRLGGTIHAIGALCTHEDANLADGDLEGDRVVCPLHASEFDVRTGRALTPPADDPEPVYDVKVEGGTVFVSTTPRASHPR